MNNNRRRKREDFFSNLGHILLVSAQEVPEQTDIPEDEGPVFNFETARPKSTELPAANFDYKAWRERFILTLLRIACVLGIALILITFNSTAPTIRILYIVLYAILLAITLIPLSYSVRAFSLIMISYVVGLNAMLAWGPFLDGSLFLLGFVVLASLLFDTRMDIFTLIFSIGTIATLGFLNSLGRFAPYGSGVPKPTATDWLIYGADFSLAGIAIAVAVSQFKNEFARVVVQMQDIYKQLVAERTNLEERVRERTEQLETKTLQLRSSATIARDVAEIQDVPDLLNAVVNLVAEHFGYYHVGLYLLDERKKNAFLQASSSIAGQQLIGQAFNAEPEQRSSISIVIESKRAFVSLDTNRASFMKDEDFPLTRSRMSLPLSVRGDVIGVLDIHSEQPQAFSVDDAEVIQTLADLIAISMDNVRLINETRTLVLQLESFTASQTLETWSQFTSRHTPAYQYTPAGVRPIFSQSNDDLNSNEDLKIPLVLHGENIGKINVRRKIAGGNWSEREKELVEKIADQVALALENSRLVDEAQKSAQRDQLIANISTRVRETLDVESVIRTAAMELRKVFDLKEAEISLGAPQAEPLRVRKNTSSLRL